MAHKKGGGSSRNGRDSRGRRLGVKRYDGEVVPFDFVRQLEPFVKFIPVCPEVEIGLDTPRDPVRLQMSYREHRAQPMAS